MSGMLSGVERMFNAVVSYLIIIMDQFGSITKLWKNSENL